MLSLVVACEKNKVSDLSALQMLHYRKRNARNTGFLKVQLTEKRAISSFRPKKNTFYVECQLKHHVASGWIVTKVHTVLEYETARYIKDYVEGNQKDRQQYADNKVLSDLFKYANNACFGGVTLRYDNRLDHIPIYDQVQVAESYAKDCHEANLCNPYRDDTDALIEKLTKKYEKKVRQIKLRMEMSSPEEVDLAKEVLAQKLDAHQDALQQIEEKRPKQLRGKYSHKTSPKTVGEQLAGYLTDVRTQSCINIETVANGSISHIVSKRKKKQTVRSMRLTGTVVLAQAKVSISKFHQNFVKAIKKYNEELDYAVWVKDIKDIVMSLILTDTYSVCYQVFIVFKDELQNVSDVDVNNFVDFLIPKHIHNIDTSNYPKDHPLYDASKKKHLHYYQREVPSPNNAYTNSSRQQNDGIFAGTFILIGRVTDVK